MDVPEELQARDDFYPVLGNLIGRASLDKIPVIDGMKVQPDEDRLKAFGAAAASSGGIALFHMIGITPEAPTLEQAFQGKPPVETIEITMEALRASRQELSHTDSHQLHLVVLGSPHFSLAEFQRRQKKTSRRQIPGHLQPRHDPACPTGRLP
jgi:predicted aconitase